MTWFLSLSLGAAAGPLTLTAQNVDLVGQIGGATYAVAVAGHYAYVGVGPRLVILDITDPSQPIQVGRTAPFVDLVEGVVVAADTAYVAAGTAGLRVIDVANPAAPAEVGFYDTPGDAQGVAVAGSFAYVADGSSGFRVVNVANPTAPIEVGFYDIPGERPGRDCGGEPCLRC